jgi:predicted secreted protein
MNTYEGTETTIQVRAGTTFVLALDAHPTAGYTWQATMDDRYLALEDRQFEPGASAPGAAGRERLVFRALQAGRCELQLAYGRPWEKEARERRTVTVEIV